MSIIISKNLIFTIILLITCNVNSTKISSERNREMERSVNLFCKIQLTPRDDSPYRKRIDLSCLEEEKESCTITKMLDSKEKNFIGEMEALEIRVNRGCTCSFTYEKFSGNNYKGVAIGDTPVPLMKKMEEDTKLEFICKNTAKIIPMTKQLISYFHDD